MRGEEVRHPGLEPGIFFFSLLTDVRDVSSRACVAPGRDKEHGEHDVTVESRATEKIFQEWLVEGVCIAFSALHGRGDHRTKLIAEKLSELFCQKVSDQIDGDPWGAMIHEGNARPDKALLRNFFLHQLGENLREFGIGRVIKVDHAGSQAHLKFRPVCTEMAHALWHVLVDRGAVAEEQWEDHEGMNSLGPFLGEERLENSCRVPREVCRVDFGRVEERDRVNRLSYGFAEFSGDPSEIECGACSVRAVIDEQSAWRGNLHVGLVRGESGMGEDTSGSWHGEAGLDLFLHWVNLHVPDHCQD